MPRTIRPARRAGCTQAPVHVLTHAFEGFEPPYAYRTHTGPCQPASIEHRRSKKPSRFSLRGGFAGCWKINQWGPRRTKNTANHVARVQVLHTNQTTCLSDGSIRLQHVAETHIPPLNSWLRQLLVSAWAGAAGGSERAAGSILVGPGSKREQGWRRRRRRSP